MPDLEQLISNWRSQMLAAGIQTPVPLDELESHLREDIERQIQSGTNPQQAFENSVRQMGSVSALKNEFKKPCGTKSKQLLTLGGMGLIITIVLNFLGLSVFHRGSSILFSHEWWSAWLPCYIVWTTFAIIGIATTLADWRARHRIAPKQG